MIPVYPRREPGAFTCPKCGASTNDPVSICAGWCGICGEYTGLCQAGRTLTPPEGVHVPGWETPCPALGIHWWCTGVPGSHGPAVKAAHPLLCGPHSAEAT